MNKVKEKWFAFGIGLLCGTFLYFLFYGIRRVDFTNDAWIYSGGDILQHYLGWQFFRDGEWQFPLGLTNRMLYPGSTSVIYTDSIPLFAVFFKIFRRILPETFQYLGLYGMLCFMLQGGMGALIAYRFGKSKVYLALASCLFVVSPVMLQRMYAHTALAAHFTILMAIYLWLNTELSWKKAVLYWSLLGALTVGLHMYLVPMIGIILVAFCIRRLLEKIDTWKQSGILIVVFCATALLALYVYGGLYGETTVSGSGLGWYNANLNTFINGMGISAFMPALVTGTSGQYEGFGYLGLGVLLLFIPLLVSRTIRVVLKNQRIEKAEAVSMLWVVAVSMILAVSTEIYFGDKHLLSVHLPSILENLLGIFRSSGRFVWPIVYFTILYAVKWAADFSHKKYCLAIMGICCLLQVSDMRMYCFNYENEDINANYAYAQNPAWSYISEHYDKIIVMGRQPIAVQFNIASYAARNHMAISRFVFARNQDVEINLYMDEINEELLAGNADEKAIYILNNYIYRKDYNFHVYVIDDLYVGTVNEIEGLEEIDICDYELKVGIGQCLVNGEDCNTERILHSGGKSYAPDLDMRKGTYKLKIEGERINSADIRVYSLRTGKEYEKWNVVSTANQFQCSFQLDEDAEYMEFIIENSSNEDIKIQKMIVEKMDEKSIASEMPEKDFYIATHYFANEWPLNFWNAEWDTLEEDFQQIKNDGFNTIIIVVPWREFQPEMAQVSYNETAFLRMRCLFETAEKVGLYVQVRLGYLNDYYGEQNSAERFYEIVGNAKVRDVWIDYAQTIYKVCSDYSNFRGGFITWEDFWHNYALVDYVGGEESALVFAEKAGFGEYLSEKYSLEEFNSRYSTNFMCFEEVGVPERKEAYATEWFCFIDDFTMDLLDSTREVFPGLSMEVRTDRDPIGAPEGERGGAHESTWACGDAEYTAIMYKPSQGVGVPEKPISSDEALDNLEKWLEKIYRNNGQKPIYMEQFLYVDNTAKFIEEGLIVQEDQLGDYIVNCADILQTYTNGYGVWAYRDYCNNMLYNSQFALELEGWNTDGKVGCVEENGSKWVQLESAGGINQSISSWRATAAEKYYFSVEYMTNGVCELVITVGTQSRNVNIEGAGKLELEFEREEDLLISIQANSKVLIDNVKLYSHIQTQRLYSMDNQPLQYVEAVRILNDKLKERD